MFMPGASMKLTESWWKDGKPAALTKTGLSEALREFEVKQKKFLASKELEDYGPVMRALRAVDDARVDTIAKCGSNPLYKTTKDALGKAGIIAQSKALYKSQVETVVSEKVTKYEANVKTFVEKITGLAKRAGMIKAELAAAKASGDPAAMKEVAKKVTALDADHGVRSVANPVEEIKYLTTKLGASASEFPEQMARINAATAKANEVGKLSKAIDAFVKDNLDLLPE